MSWVGNNLLFLYYQGRRKVKLPLKKLFKASFLVALGPWMVLAVFSVYGRIPVDAAIFAAALTLLISLIFVAPYIRDLSALTFYVEQLSLDRNAKAPPLSFLNNVEELSAAVEKLHGSWEYRKNQLESIAAENQVIIDSLPDVLVILDKDLNITRTNRTAKNILGTDKIVAILNDPEIHESLRRILEDGRRRNLSYAMETPPADYSVSMERLAFSRKSETLLVMAMHDVTELKLTEKTLSDFIANASHEIRTPLTSIVGFIETLQSGAKDDPETLDKFLKIMAAQSGRLSSLVGDLLSLSKLEVSQKNPPSEKVNIQEILERVKANLAWSANQKNIYMTLEFNRSIPLTIADPSQITQVFENLLGNAIKYSEENSKVGIVADMLENKLVSRRIAGVNQYIGNTDFISISFSDQGEGIAPEHLSRLTERFYRVDTARSRALGGTGLGLAIVKQILNRHGGFLKIESTLGKGSIFTVLLPVK